MWGAATSRAHCHSSTSGSLAGRFRGAPSHPTLVAGRMNRQFTCRYTHKSSYHLTEIHQGNVSNSSQRRAHSQNQNPNRDYLSRQYVELAPKKLPKVFCLLRDRTHEMINVAPLNEDMLTADQMFAPLNVSLQIGKVNCLICLDTEPELTELKDVSRGSAAANSIVRSAGASPGPPSSRHQTSTASCS